jgi:hypothetical protein
MTYSESREKTESFKFLDYLLELIIKNLATRIWAIFSIENPLYRSKS